MKNFFAPRVKPSTTKKAPPLPRNNVKELQHRLKEILGDGMEENQLDRLLRDANYSVETAVSLFFSNNNSNNAAPSTNKRSTDQLSASEDIPVVDTGELIEVITTKQHEPLIPLIDPKGSSYIDDCSSANNKSVEKSSSNKKVKSTHSKNTKPNAFDMMLSTARAPKRVEEFILIQDKQHRLSWSWITASSGEEHMCSHQGLLKWKRDIIVKEKNQIKPTSFTVATNINSNTSWEATLLDLEIRNSFKKFKVNGSGGDGGGGLSGLSVSYLKSILQKNIRRRRSMAAFRIAYEFIKLDWNAFLRRFIVIIIEDSILHPALPLLVWLMVVDSTYHDEFIVPAQVIEAVLFMVLEVSQCKVHDDVYPTENDPTSEKNQPEDIHINRRFADDMLQDITPHSKVVNNKEVNACQAEEEVVSFDVTESDDYECVLGDMGSSIIRSLVIRAEYGGMKGDVSMLYNKAKIWKDRFCGKEGYRFDYEGLNVLSPLSQSERTASTATATARIAQSDRIQEESYNTWSEAATISGKETKISKEDAEKVEDYFPSHCFWYLSPSFVKNCYHVSDWVKFIFDVHVMIDDTSSYSTTVSMGDSSGVCDEKGCLEIYEIVPPVRFERSNLFHPIKKSDVLDAGIDFHIFPNCCNYEIIKFMISNSSNSCWKNENKNDVEDMAQQLSNISEGERKSAMWHCSSGINARKFLSSKIAESSFQYQSDHHKHVWGLMKVAHSLMVKEKLSRGLKLA